MKKAYSLFVAILTFITIFNITAFAEEEQLLHLFYTDNEKPLTGVNFSLYYLGKASDGIIDPDSKFSSYSCDFDVSDTEKIKSLAITLEAYVLRDKIEFLYSGKTDEKGFTDFGGNALSDGAYLVIGESHFQDEKYYFPEPVIIVLPYGDTSTVILKPKFELEDDEKEDFISLTVLKAWEGDNSSDRPNEIEVELLKDGEIIQTVTLDKNNSWKYVWENLPSENHWTVAEKTVAPGYKVSLSLTGKTYLITNTKESAEEDTTLMPPTDEEPEIPETGMLMWPIPYLALFGLLIFIIGFVYYRKSEINNDTTK